MEDARLTLATLPDRLAEHPETIVVLTNMFYGEAPELFPRKQESQSRLKWWDVPLNGSTSHDFQQQIGDLESVLDTGWQTTSSPATGNPIYEYPSVLVLYRNLILAAQPYRSRTSAEGKVKSVLAPIARALAPCGRLVVVQSTGHDPGMEVVRRIWPGDEPFATPRHLLIKELNKQLNEGGEKQYHFEGDNDAQALFTYHLHAMPNEVTNRLSTSTALGGVERGGVCGPDRR